MPSPLAKQELSKIKILVEFLVPSKVSDRFARHVSIVLIDRRLIPTMYHENLLLTAETLIDSCYHKILYQQTHVHTDVIALETHV